MDTKSSAVKKHDGVTDAERYLARLCEKSFLSLWSYPGVYRDEGRAAGGHGKEVCDLLVVFGDDIVIFSDKFCQFPASGSLALDWSRWFRRAVIKSADQVWGAERWIRQNPGKLFLNRECTQPFPIAMDNISGKRFHRVVVAHDSAARCRAHFGGSGSLMIRSDLQGTAHYKGDVTPFEVGNLDPRKGFVHVLDDTSLEIVLDALTTTADFVSYLTKKEAFLTGRRIVHAAGEEELLAFYLRDINDQNEHDFIVPEEYNLISIDEGLWTDFSTSKARAAQLEADQVSYVWDQIIEKFSGHILDGTVTGGTDQTLSEHEQAVRWLAREGRTVRRLLAMSLLDLLNKAPERPRIRATRVIPPPRPGSPYYTFLIAGLFPDVSEEGYREFRRSLLRAQCMAVKLRFPEAQDIVGFATEPKDSERRSEDVLYLNARDWNSEIEAEAKELQEKLGMLVNLNEVHRGTVYEYPPQPNL